MKTGETIFDKNYQDFFSPLTTNQRKIPLRMPNLSELDVVRHYTYLSTLNFGVDSGFYPLGSCTMKYNPKILEKIASLTNFTNLHPFQDSEDCQGILKALFDFKTMLSELFGYADFTLQPCAGAHGEHTGTLIIKKYFESKNDNRKIVLIPDTAHGTNPASAVLAGFEIKKIGTDQEGNVDLNELEKILTEHQVAALMLTNPSTLGLFETNILKIAEMVHQNGGLLYYDGANANAIIGRFRPGDMGFDVCHLNLHKTFATPHGGGGPGSGPVGVSAKLVNFLPQPQIIKHNNNYAWSSLNNNESIGRMHGQYGNVLVAIKAFVYLLTKGLEGLQKSSLTAVLNANYLKEELKDVLDLPYNRTCMHEFVLSAATLKKQTGVSTLDLAKNLIDHKIHPPTIYFPQLIHECLMIEPTESESKNSLDSFIKTFKQITNEAIKNPEKAKNAPYKAIVGRMNEAQAVKNSKLTFFDK